MIGKTIIWREKGVEDEHIIYKTTEHSGVVIDAFTISNSTSKHTRIYVVQGPHGLQEVEMEKVIRLATAEDFRDIQIIDNTIYIKKEN